VSRNAPRPRAAPALGRLVVLGAALVVATAGCRDAAPAAERDAAAFASAERAAWALLEACAATAAHVGAVLGADERAALARHGFRDPADVARLGAAGLQLEYVTDDRVRLLLGSGPTPLPVPLVREAAGWRFRAPPGDGPSRARARP
jgi:hypothetical protein